MSTTEEENDASRHYSVLPCAGGPADGAEARADGAVYYWIDAEGIRHRWPAPGAGLYFRTGDRWEFQGYGAWSCECGAYLSARDDGRAIDACPLCGAARGSARMG